VIPVGREDGRVSKPVRNKAERLEKGVNGIYYQLERQGAE
jgi:hypothetical protein